ncbi:MAG: FtsX-like permease family protein [Bacteroidales bacterium]
MNLELFIARRIHFSKDGEKRKVSPPAIRIAIAGIAIGLAVMILAVAIVIGFKKEIREKVIGFGSHVQITNFDSNTTFETHPVAASDSLIEALAANPSISYIERFATKPGVLKTDSAFMAVVLKGVGPEYNWDFFRKNIKQGDVLQLSDSATSNDVLISAYIANKMHLKLGDSFFTYFVQENVRARKFRIAGIYQTDFTDYDKLFLISDLRHVQRLNGWRQDQVSGLELLVNDYDRVDEVSDDLYFKLLNKKDAYGASYYVRSIKELNPQIFSWLDLLDMNVWVILILMSLVAAFTMISGLLIIILERTNMIGILKALGYSNLNIRKVFLYVSLFLIGKGLIWGNVIGIGVCLLQQHFHWLKLDPETYYLDAVPIEMNYFYFLLLNIGTVLISVFVLLGPSYVISRMNPVNSIRFD